SLTLREKVSSLKFKEKSSDSETLSYKLLLLAIVKLIHADPRLMLHNPGKPGHEIQASTAELITGLVTLVPQCGMPDVAQEAMEALLVLHQPEIIELWNPDAPIATFWDISSQVLHSICQKLFSHQLPNCTEVLKWLREILICRNKFLLKFKEKATLGSGGASCRQAQASLEGCLHVYLWSPDVEAVLVAMSCFRHLCEEAEVRCGAEEVSVHHVLPNYNTCMEFGSSANLVSTGHVALQKRVMALLRRIEHPTSGNTEAWEETHLRWEQTTKQLLNYPKTKVEDGQVSESLHRTVVRRRMSHASGGGVGGGGGGVGGGAGGGSPDAVDPELLQEWINTTGFLSALGGVCLQPRGPHGGTGGGFTGCGAGAGGAGGGAGASLGTHSPPMGGGGGAGERKNSMAGPSDCHSSVVHVGHHSPPVAKFLSHILRLMVCTHEKVGLHIRSNIKELVGLELSPALYPILFSQLRASISKFFDGQGQ
ncbi:unnamed protein product, partial [Lampetra planeri]